MHHYTGISHLLLDIEGTTCPVSFVAEVLFPYAAARIGPHLQTHRQDAAVQTLLRELEEIWKSDPDPEARALRQRLGSAADGAEHYLQLLIRQDRKASPLKDLQARIWDEGYATGALVAPLYADVPEALRRWHRAGLTLAVYSSGSVPAQQRLYRHSNAGDLSGLFSHWFDTRTGGKQDPESYRSIASAMAVDPRAVLFVSDALAECDAAAAAGMAVLFSRRPGNPQQDGGRFPVLTNASTLTFTP